MPDRSTTLVLVPDGRGKTRSVRVTHRALSLTVASAALLAMLVTALTGVYVRALLRAAEAPRLRAENAALQERWRVAEQRFDDLRSHLEEVQRINERLRQSTRLDDSAAPVAFDDAVDVEPGIGPVNEPDGLGFLGLTDSEKAAATRAAAGPESALSSAGGGGAAASKPKPAGGLLGQLDAVAARLEEAREETQGLVAFYQDQRAILATAPSIWPVRGYVTSDFSTRSDPFLGFKVAHEGLDIGAEKGTPVHAPGDASVTFSGTQGGYGLAIVLDHGHGLKTRYGHLSKVFVKAGQHVTRGDVIGLVGSSGRSTGPHLHYEVRVNGVADNPRKFILEE